MQSHSVQTLVVAVRYALRNGGGSKSALNRRGGSLGRLLLHAYSLSGDPPPLTYTGRALHTQVPTSIADLCRAREWLSREPPRPLHAPPARRRVEATLRAPAHAAKASRVKSTTVWKVTSSPCAMKTPPHDLFGLMA
jgi:hypothetical protein